MRLQYVLCIAMLGLLGVASCGGEAAAPPAPRTPVEFRLADHHVHVLSPRLVGDWKSLGVPFSRPDEFYSSTAPLFERGVERALLLSMAYLYGSEDFREMGLSPEDERERVRGENDFVAGLARATPERLVAFGAVDPMRPYAAEEARRCLDEAGMKGLKLHLLNSGVDLANGEHVARLASVVGVARERKAPVLIHLGTVEEGEGERYVETLLRDVAGGVELYVAHLGGSGGYGAGAEEVMEAFARRIGPGGAFAGAPVFFEVSAVVLVEESYDAQPPDRVRLERLAEDLRAVGLERVLFGSDHPVFDAQDYAHVLKERMALSAEEVERVLANRAPVLAR